MEIDNSAQDFWAQKKIVIEKWEDLVKDLEKMIILAKKVGGTKGHNIGSIKDKSIKLLEFAKNTW